MSNYGTILKTTGVIGGTRVFTILSDLAKAKVIASILGPAGIGIYGLYQSIAVMLVAVGDLGLSQSGVRQIALANSQKDSARVPVVYSVMRKTVLISASLCSLLMCLFSAQISRHLFDTELYRWGICIVSVYVFCSILSHTQLAVLNGVRRIKEMSFSRICGTVFGGLIACSAVFFWGKQGISCAFAGLGLALVLSSWYFLRRLGIPIIHVSWRNWSRELRGLLGLGIGLVIVGLLAHITNYLSRVYIRQSLGLEAVGIYQACWSVSSLYVGLVLQAMGVDFLPRLMKHIKDPPALVQNLNEQMELGMVLCLPCVFGILMLAPLVLRILYSADFVHAASIMRWQVVGVALRLLTWPLGYLLVALGRIRLHVAFHALFYSLEFTTLWVAVRWFGLGGLGPQFVVAYIFYLFLGVLAAIKLVQFRPSLLLIKILLFFGFGLFWAVINFRYFENLKVVSYICWFALIAGSSWFTWHTIKSDFGLIPLNLFKRMGQRRA